MGKQELDNLLKTGMLKAQTAVREAIEFQQDHAMDAHHSAARTVSCCM
jgi:hypothetical protein